MQADFSVELAREDPVLELPWRSDDGALRYYDLKACPELVQHVPEAVAYPELGAFLVRMNAPSFPLLTAKCDAWSSREISPEEEIFSAECKFVSYVDLVFVAAKDRASFARHEKFVAELCRLLQRAPDIAAAAEFVIRRCYCSLEDKPCGGDNLAMLENKGNMSGEPARRVAGKGPSLESCSKAEGRHHRATNETCENSEPQADDNCASADTRERLTAEETRDGHPLEGARKSFSGQTAEHCLGERIAEYCWAKEAILGDSNSEVPKGFCISAYVTGFCENEEGATGAWTIALALVQNAIVQLATK